MSCRCFVSLAFAADMYRHDIYEKSASGTMIVFIHDFGNLRVEAEYSNTVEPDLENSYLVRLYAITLVTFPLISIDLHK